MPLIVTARQAGTGIAAMYRRYAEWLVSISWKRFMLLSLVLLIVAGILSGLPPFTWDLVEPKIVNSKHARPSRDGGGGPLPEQRDARWKTPGVGRPAARRAA